MRNINKLKKSFDKLCRKSSHQNPIDENEDEPLCNIFLKTVDENENKPFLTCTC